MPDPDPQLLFPVLNQYTSACRASLLPALHAVQSLYGYIPEFAAESVASKLKVPLADVYGVITFYSHFHTQPPAAKRLQVCKDPACALKTRPRVPDGVSIEEVPCLGLCDLAPVAAVEDRQAAWLSTLGLEAVLPLSGRLHNSHIGGDVSILTRNCGQGQVTSLSAYQASGGYAGLEKALRLTPGEVIAQVKASGLVGRGGAAFPAGVKWEGAASASEKTRYVICNADESEPGTFKDRVMLEDDPHHMIEGLIIAAYAIGARTGYVYIRVEYEEAYHILLAALAEARQAGWLGDNIHGSGFSFDVEVRRGAGAYVCGEETALFESIEGKRGLPRIKPPFPTTSGLFGKPTVINNVETLCNIPEILRSGAADYTARGTQKSTGTKLFCVSGDVVHPGLYELPFGVTLRHLIYDLAGGVANQQEFGAALVGGAAGSFASAEELDTRLSFEDMRAAGLALGAGVVMVFHAGRDLRPILSRLARFFAEESCGKCFPCQLGTQRQLEIMERVAAGLADADDPARLGEIAQTMLDASICGLGQSAAMAIQSAYKRWPQLFAAGVGGR
jgi:NADH-quinone oxidoreductase subunit F